MQINTCLNCCDFCIWDSDPCCLKFMCISLPKLPCEYFNECTELFSELHTNEWNHCKIDFFSRYTISNELKDKYLKLFPEDENLIDK